MRSASSRRRCCPTTSAKSWRRRCAPVEALDLEPTRAELHEQLAAMVASLDAGALEAVAQGCSGARLPGGDRSAAPRRALETEAFAALAGRSTSSTRPRCWPRCSTCWPRPRRRSPRSTSPPSWHRSTTALDEVVATIATIDPAELLAPVTAALDTATGTVREALHLDDLTTKLDAIEPRRPASSTDAGGRQCSTPSRRRGAAWSPGCAATTTARGGVLRGLLGGLLPGVAVGGVPEVIAWMRGERDGTVVVHDRLARASAEIAAATGAGHARPRRPVVELEAPTPAGRRRRCRLPSDLAAAAAPGRPVRRPPAPTSAWSP